MNQKVIEALNYRYATKIYDTTKKVSDEDFVTILESARLAPSSLGVEPWQFLVIENSEIRQKLKDAAWGQPKLTDADKLVVVTAKKNFKSTIVDETVARNVAQLGVTEEAMKDYRGMLEGFVGSFSEEELNNWAIKQTYIALGLMIETSALLGVDSCPMEGFDANQVNSILELESKGLAVATMITFGYRGEDKYAGTPKVRRQKDDVITVIS